MRTLTKCLAALAVFLIPATVFAQASLTGTVRDASGRRAPRRDRRSRQPGADREDPHGRHRRHRASTASSICVPAPIR